MLKRKFDDEPGVGGARYHIAATFAFLAAMWGAPASAAPITYTWTMSGYLGSASPGNDLEFSGSENTSVKLKVRSYSVPDSGGGFTDAATTLYSGGIGVVNQFSDGGYPNHAIDNRGHNDFVLFEFDSDDFTVMSFMLGWRKKDSDVRVWVGGLGPDLDLGSDCGGACSIADLTSTLGFVGLPEFSNVAKNVSTSLGTGLTGRYMLVSAGNEWDKQDFFKLKQVVAKKTTPSDPPEVAEPETIAIFGVGLAALIYLRRRQKAG